MTEKTGSLAGAGGRKLFARSWWPEGEVRARLLLVHGYAEHSARYAHVARFLTERGIAVFAFDHRGHGRSEGKKAYIERYELLLKDITAGLDWVRGQAKATPIFLFGHSLGGALVAMYAVSRQPPVDGVVLSGAALKVNEDLAPLLQKVSQIVGRLAPTLPTVQLQIEHVSRDPEVVRAYREDPLMYTGRVLARTGAELIRLGREVHQVFRRFTYPVLVMHGTDDRLADIAGSRMFYQQAAAPDKTLKTYEGAYHELVNDLNREEVIADIYTWIEARLPVSG